jgi:hypothetical protein
MRTTPAFRDPSITSHSIGKDYLSLYIVKVFLILEPRIRCVGIATIACYSRQVTLPSSHEIVSRPAAAASPLRTGRADRGHWVSFSPVVAE